MATLKEIVVDLAEAAKRGVLTDQELRRFLQYLTAAPQAPEGKKMVQASVSTSVMASLPGKGRAATNGRQLRRQYLGRGEYGWVDLSRARELNLVALLELKNPVDRLTRLENIQKRWGRYFQSRDVEILPAARQPRWQKACEWDLHYMRNEGLVQSPRRGVWELTQAGIQKAKALGKSLP